MKDYLFITVVLLMSVFLSLGCNVNQNNRQENKEVMINTPAPENLKPNQKRINRNDFGNDWAFSVDTGILECNGKNGIGALTFAAGNTIYAVNGVAKSTKKYLPIENIWLPNTSISGAKKDLSKVLDIGLSLCK